MAVVRRERGGGEGVGKKRAERGKIADSHDDFAVFIRPAELKRSCAEQ